MARGRSPLALLCALAAALALPAAAAAQDTTPPLNTTAAAPAGWLDEPYVVLLSGTDETLFDRMEWTLDGGATINPPDGDGNAVVAAEGVHTFETRAVDAEGNDSGWRAETVRIDLTAPGDTTYAGSTAWRSTPASVLVNGTDGLSGVDRVEWRLDGGGVQSGPNNSSAPVAGDGQHTLETRIFDVAGNSSPWVPRTLRIDTVLPLDETAAPAGWQRGSVMVPVTGSDAHSGVASVRYRVDGGIEQVGFSPTVATISGDGEHTLHTRVVDGAGNSTGWREHPLRIDTTAPDNHTEAAPAAWRDGSWSVAVTGADSGSGVADVQWRVNSGAAHDGPAGSVATVTGTGDNLLETRVRDVAGNFSAWRAEHVRIDKVDPLDTTPATPGAAVANPYTIAVSGSDAHSGLAHVEWQVDGGEIRQGASGTPVTITGHGLHTLRTRAVDNVGRATAWRTQNVRIDVALNNDAVAPALAVTGVPAGWRTAPQTVTLEATDAGAGVDRIEWRVDGSGLHSVAGASATVEIAEEGVHELEARAVDLAENVSAWVTRTVRLDFTLPADEIAIGPGWQSARSFTAAASDAVSGIDAVEYQLDGGATQRVAAGTVVNLGADGTYTVRHRAVDRAAHATPWVTSQLRIDSVDPLNTTAVPDPAWRPAALSLDLTGSDAGSGLAKLQWRVDGGDVHDGGPAVIGGDGVHTLETRAVDVAGNATDWRADTVRVDVTAPVDETPAAPAGWRATPYDVTVAGSDGDGSGVDRVERELDGGPVSGDPAVTVAGDGVHTLRTRIVDAVGHASEWRSHTVRIDSVAPAAAVSCPSAAVWRSAPATCTVTAGGGPSGLASLTLAVDGAAPRPVAPGAAVTLSTDGVHALALRAVDGAGNRRDASAAVRIDRTAPTAAVSCAGTTCTVGGSDARSGVASLAISVDGGAWQPGTTFTVPRGTVRARAVDRAGNATISAPAEVAEPPAEPQPEVRTVPIYLRGGRASSALIGALRASRADGGAIAVDLRPLAVGRGRFRVELAIRAGKRTRTVRRTVTVRRRGTLPRIRAGLTGARARATVTLQVRRRAGKRWRGHASGRLVLER